MDVDDYSEVCAKNEETKNAATMWAANNFLK